MRDGIERDGLRPGVRVETENPRIQVSWLADGDWRDLVVVSQNDEMAVAWMLCVDIRAHRIRVASGRVARTPDRHVARDVANMMAVKKPKVTDLADWGLIKGTGKDGIAGRSLAHARDSRPHTGYVQGMSQTWMSSLWYPGSVSGCSSGMRGTGHTHQVLFRQMMERDGFDLPGTSPLAFGFTDLDTKGDESRAIGGTVHNDRSVEPTACLREAIVGFRWDGDLGRFLPEEGLVPAGGREGDDEGEENAVERHINGFVRAFVDADAVRILNGSAWTRRGYAAYAGSDQRAVRRRQAAALYPALAPVLVARQPVRDLIDAGRPFEDALLGELRLLECQRGQGRLSRAALKRMRALPRRLDYDEVGLYVRLAAGFPLDWLPADERGWRSLRVLTGDGYHNAVWLGLRVDTLFGWMREHWLDPELRLYGPEDDPSVYGGQAGDDILGRAKDMAERMVETLVRPCILSMGGTPSRGRDVAIAGNILFGAKGLPAVDAVQERWHRTLPTLEAAMPLQDGINAWPELFDPFVASNGYMISCLTNEGALKAEGGHGRDAEGVKGLRHCVGGWGRKCYTGERHIASVRRKGKRGMERVSTVELTVRPGGGGGYVLDVRQHCAFRNEVPGNKAKAALNELLEAVNEGLHDIHAEAATLRDGSRFEEAYDWSIPGALEQSFEAWAPHLPRATRDAGLDGLRGRLSTLPPAWETDDGSDGTEAQGIEAFYRAFEPLMRQGRGRRPRPVSVDMRIVGVDIGRSSD